MQTFGNADCIETKVYTCTGEDDVDVLVDCMGGGGVMSREMSVATGGGHSARQIVVLAMVGISVSRT